MKKAENKKPETFRQFEDLARKLAVVPKSEVDEKQAEYERERKKLKKKTKK